MRLARISAAARERSSGEASSGVKRECESAVALQLRLQLPMPLQLQSQSQLQDMGITPDEKTPRTTSIQCLMHM